MATIKMKIETRTKIGKNRTNEMHKNHVIPGVIYSKGQETQHIMVEQKEFQRVFKEAGVASVIHLQLAGKSIPVIIREIQRHPVSNHILHLDFLMLHMNEKTRIQIPIILHNKDNVKLKPSILSQLLDEIEIECLPKDIPHAAEVDVADIDFSTPIHVKDLDIAQNSKITIHRELSDIVCTLTEPPRAEKEPEAEKIEEAPPATA
jgi:large subunit ribosomal protein L25